MAPVLGKLLAMRRAAQFPSRPAAGYLAHDGMPFASEPTSPNQSAARQDRQHLASYAERAGRTRRTQLSSF
jgi:hypothetical protein